MRIKYKKSSKTIAGSRCCNPLYQLWQYACPKAADCARDFPDELKSYCGQSRIIKTRKKNSPLPAKLQSGFYKTSVQILSKF